MLSYNNNNNNNNNNFNKHPHNVSEIASPSFRSSAEPVSGVVKKTKSILKVASSNLGERTILCFDEQRLVDIIDDSINEDCLTNNNSSSLLAGDSSFLKVPNTGRKLNITYIDEIIT